MESEDDRKVRVECEKQTNEQGEIREREEMQRSLFLSISNEKNKVMKLRFSSVRSPLREVDDIFPDFHFLHLPLHHSDDGAYIIIPRLSGL